MGGGGVKGNKCRMTRSTFYVLKSTGRCFALLVEFLEFLEEHIMLRYRIKTYQRKRMISVYL